MRTNDISGTGTGAERELFGWINQNRAAAAKATPRFVCPECDRIVSGSFGHATTCESRTGETANIEADSPRAAALAAAGTGTDPVIAYMAKSTGRTAAQMTELLANEATAEDICAGRTAMMTLPPGDEDEAGKVTECDLCGYRFSRPQARRTCLSPAACAKRAAAR